MSKVIFKMTFKHPNLKDTVSKNVSHVNYIATRSGVDKTVTEKDLKKELEKGIEYITPDDEMYLKYIDERPRSHGLFGQDGIEDLKSVQEEISNVKSFVWRGIISLKEDDAKRLGYLDKEKWQDMLRKKVPDMANEMGITITNLRWVGAIHMEKGHPHAHIMLWEKTPKKTIGVVSSKKLDIIRKMYTDEIFEEERMIYLQEKNAMRDLIRDLAKNDISQATKIIKDVRSTQEEIRALIKDANQEGIGPRLFNVDEYKLAEKIENLAKMMPGKGRVALKFMPEEVKEEVRAIADEILRQPEFTASLEKNLKTVEELTKMYTGKDEAIQKARENAYSDLRDRIGQLILKGAVESQRDNNFYVDKELSQKAINVIQNISTQINLFPERIKVLEQVATSLIETGHSDEQIVKNLVFYSEKESLNLKEDDIKSLLKDIKEDKEKDENKDMNFISSTKKTNKYLSTLKLAGYSEEKAFEILSDVIKKQSKELEKKLLQLKEEGLLKKSGIEYKLTNKGISEFLKIKNLDDTEKAIFKLLESENKEEIKIVSFKELLDNNEVFYSLYDKDIKEFKVGKFDLKIREEFGEENKLTLKELEEKIHNKYINDNITQDTSLIDKAEKEFEIIKNRIEKLCINGYIQFNKDTNIYSFTKEGLEALDNVSDKIEFTRYDANVTLSYIDNCEDGILTEDFLRKSLHKEMVNQRAKNYYDRFINLINSGQAEKYININDDGVITSSEEGKWLGVNLSKLNKYFYKAKGELTEDKLKELCKEEFGADAEKQFHLLNRALKREIEKGHIIKLENGAYKIDPIINDINKLLYQIYKEGGELKKDSLREVLEKNIPNKEAEKQFKYLLKRLDNLKEKGYLKGQEKEYILTNAGIEKREDLLVPQRVILKEKLKYLERLKLIESTDKGYKVTENYYKLMENIALSKKEGLTRKSELIDKEIYELIERTQDKINIGKIERNNKKLCRGKYINNEYEEIKTDYESIRSYNNVVDTTEKTIKNLSTALLVSGLSVEETKNVINSWNLKSNSNIDQEKIDRIVKKVHEKVEDNDKWGKTTIISTNDWKEMFKSFGLDEKDIPRWIYKGENWKEFNPLYSVVNDIWKSVWREIERQRLQTEAQAEIMKKQQIKQQSISQNKEAIKEYIKKNKDKTMYKEEELER